MTAATGTCSRYWPATPFSAMPGPRNCSLSYERRIRPSFAARRRFASAEADQAATQRRAMEDQATILQLGTELDTARTEHQQQITTLRQEAAEERRTAPRSRRHLASKPTQGVIRGYKCTLCGRPAPNRTDGRNQR